MDEHDRKKSLNQRLESVCWALFLIMIGCLWLVPEGTVPNSAWILGAGAIMIGLSLVRGGVGIKPSGFTVIVGILVVALGLSDIYDIEVPVIPILVIVAGVSVIVKPLLARKKADEPKADEPADSDDQE